jgi:subtilisin family serine protease
MAAPNDSLYPTSYWYRQPSRRDIHAEEAWNLTTGDTSIVVAIADSGVLPYHPDLGGTTLGLSGQIWTNWAERGGLAGVDDDANGYVDDVHGWDFVSLVSSTERRTADCGRGQRSKRFWRTAIRSQDSSRGDEQRAWRLVRRGTQGD